MLDQSTATDGEQEFGHDSLALSLARSSHATLVNIESRYQTYYSAQDHHALFARLYYHSTVEWLNHLDGKHNVEFLHLLIEKFYAIYDHHVTLVIEGKRNEPGQHWLPYFRMVEKLNRSPNGLTIFKLTFAAAHAHIRFDMADAIIASAIEYEHRFGNKPDLKLARRQHLDMESSWVMERTMSGFANYLADTPHQSIVLGTVAKLPIAWLPMCQSWRWSAWRDAQRFLDQNSSDGSQLLYCHDLAQPAQPRNPNRALR